MTDNTNDANDKPRTQINDLPRPEEELSTDEQKQVQGGATRKIDYNRTGGLVDDELDLPAQDATRKTDYSS